MAAQFNGGGNGGEFAVVIDNISKHFGGAAAVDGVSLRVRRGAFFGLLGPNGAGKTTLIGVLGGLVRPDSGRAAVLGFDAEKQLPEVRANIGIVPQELTYDPFFTVREALTFQSKYYGLGKNAAWVGELLARLHLADKANTNARKLSGGMKRRLMIAQALVHKPPVIILDEPTAGVDINLRLSLWAFIREFNEAGHTIILTTHYLEEAEVLCGEIALMNGGRVVAQGKTRELLAEVETEICARVLFVGGAPAAAPPHRAEGDLCFFDLKNYADLEPLLAKFRAAGAEIAELTVSPPKLEDVFVRLVGGR